MSEPTNDGTITAASRYSALEQDRQVYLQRARECSVVTLPMLFPPQGHSSATRYPTPFQSLGARGTNNLASKLLLALFPPEMSFFRLKVSPKVQAQLDTQQDPNDPSGPSEADKFDQMLSDYEQEVLGEIESRNTRTHLFEALKQCIVGGNTLLYIPKEGIRVYNLEQYVVQRDPEGNVLEIVVKEMVAPNALPESVREAVLQEVLKDAKTEEEKRLAGDSRTVGLYTWVRREKKRYVVCQEVKGFKIPDSDGFYPLDKSPWLPIRWTIVHGENYGRGLVEEYLGDLASLESLSKSLVEAAQVAAKCLFLVKPNGSTRLHSLNNKRNGAIVEGDAEEVGTMKLDKSQDLTYASNLAKELETRISFAFLLNSAIQRQGERVTAEEIRYMAGELEDALGGVYSLLAEELQLPLAVVVMNQMQKTGDLPPLPKGLVRPAIVTGLDALGRNHEASRLDAFVEGIVKDLPQAVEYINISGYLSRKSAALGIKANGLVKNESEVQQQRQAAMQAQMVNNLGGPAMQAGAKMATNQQNIQAQQQQSQQESQQ